MGWTRFRCKWGGGRNRQKAGRSRHNRKTTSRTLARQDRALCKDRIDHSELEKSTKDKGRRTKEDRRRGLSTFVLRPSSFVLTSRPRLVRRLPRAPWPDATRPGATAPASCRCLR